MTPTKRRATPATQGPARVAPDVPMVADPAAPSAATTDDGAQLLGPEGEPLGHDVAAPPKPSIETADPAPTQARRRPGGLYPLPVWPD